MIIMEENNVTDINMYMAILVKNSHIYVICFTKNWRINHVNLALTSTDSFQACIYTIKALRQAIIKTL